jgi:hypothetical protein
VAPLLRRVAQIVAQIVDVLFDYGLIFMIGLRLILYLKEYFVIK